MWSGIAAGIALSLSVYCQAFLLAGLEGSDYASVIACFGYTVGFVIVVLGRLQLFTENTITVVLPLLSQFSKRCLVETLRLWGIVFAANMVGTFSSAWGAIHIFPADKTAAFLEVSHHLLDYSFWDCFVLGIPSGFLIAVMVWLLLIADRNLLFGGVAAGVASGVWVHHRTGFLGIRFQIKRAPSLLTT